MVIVAFDESGNSGPHLLDPDQPVYGLASVCLDHESADFLVNRRKGPQASELHNSRMRGRISGRAGILEGVNVRALRRNLFGDQPRGFPWV
jgi:hypothetical protein